MLNLRVYNEIILGIITQYLSFKDLMRYFVALQPLSVEDAEQFKKIMLLAIFSNNDRNSLDNMRMIFRSFSKLKFSQSVMTQEFITLLKNHVSLKDLKMLPDILQRNYFIQEISGNPVTITNEALDELFSKSLSMSETVARTILNGVMNLLTPQQVSYCVEKTIRALKKQKNNNEKMFLQEEYYNWDLQIEKILKLETANILKIAVMFLPYMNEKEITEAFHEVLQLIIGEVLEEEGYYPATEITKTELDTLASFIPRLSSEAQIALSDEANKRYDYFEKISTHLKDDTDDYPADRINTMAAYLVKKICLPKSLASIDEDKFTAEDIISGLNDAASAFSNLFECFLPTLIQYMPEIFTLEFRKNAVKLLKAETRYFWSSGDFLMVIALARLMSPGEITSVLDLVIECLISTKSISYPSEINVDLIFLIKNNFIKLASLLSKNDSIKALEVFVDILEDKDITLQVIAMNAIATLVPHLEAKDIDGDLIAKVNRFVVEQENNSSASDPLGPLFYWALQNVYVAILPYHDPLFSAREQYVKALCFMTQWIDASENEDDKRTIQFAREVIQMLVKYLLSENQGPKTSDVLLEAIIATIFIEVYESDAVLNASAMDLIAQLVTKGVDIQSYVEKNCHQPDKGWLSLLNFLNVGDAKKYLNNNSLAKSAVIEAKRFVFGREMEKDPRDDSNYYIAAVIAAGILLCVAASQEKMSITACMCIASAVLTALGPVIKNNFLFFGENENKRVGADQFADDAITQWLVNKQLF